MERSGRRPVGQLELTLAPHRRWGGRRAGAGAQARSTSSGTAPAAVRCRAAFSGARDAQGPSGDPVAARGGRRPCRRTQLSRELRPGGLSPRVVHAPAQPRALHRGGSGCARPGARDEGDRFRLARAVNRVFGRHGPVLLERFHSRVLRTPLEVRRVLAYVLLNARRHAGRPERVGRVDPASSGRWFDGWRRVPSSEKRGDVGTAPVAAPRTWLLRVGWRKHGLIDPDERPGPATG